MVRFIEMGIAHATAEQSYRRASAGFAERDMCAANANGSGDAAFTEVQPAGLTLGVCDWGFCVYREEYSACRGGAFGPSPARREPSTCARCKNFVVSSEHSSYWLDQARRHEALLRDPSLPTQTLKIARERLTEALSIVRSIKVVASK
jgi:hypothetical protein